MPDRDDVSVSEELSPALAVDDESCSVSLVAEVFVSVSVRL
jgi:hypothetical protein